MMAEPDSTLSALPLCMVSLNRADFHPIAVNEMFEGLIGPLFKFANTDFVCAASDDKCSDARCRFRSAIEDVVSGNSERGRVRGIEMVTLAGDSGFPIRKLFDWFISCTDEVIILLGDPCSEQDVAKSDKDSELIDFFQNAPIALHWLSGEGKVLWANQTELNVLGYTKEEYIGQPIMKFCPDEEELVLEIFKQFGSGNAIRDVPVRFRTKDGKIVHLLIDSNVKYETDGSFGHTRCFIRDDTGRKIREAKASLLLEETKRSLKMLDNFMARSLHHLRTPLHVTQNMVDEISSFLKSNEALVSAKKDECLDFCKVASDQIESSVCLLNDIADLAKFDQGSVLHITPEVFDLERFGKKILKKIPPTKNRVETVLELCGSDAAEVGPSMAVTDPKVLRRVLTHLLNNAVDITEAGTVSIGIGYKNKRLTFTVSDTGSGLEMPADAAPGDLPTIFQRYHQELLPEETVNLTVATSIRERVEQGINTHKKSGLGIGLSLTYHLVQALGGELRCSSNKGGGCTFQFSLPRNVSFNSTISVTSTLVPMRIVREGDIGDITTLIGNKRMLEEHTKDDGTSTTTDSTSTCSKKGRTGGIPSSFEMPTDTSIPNVPAELLAEWGVKSQDPPSVLVVEDTKACAKMLCMTLSRFNCSSKVAENGKIAIDILREATPGTYDLILMDLRMPVMDGLEATRIIKSQLNITTPVVALTGDDNEKTRIECKEIGFDAFHGKPMKRDNLKEVIMKFTGYRIK